MRLLRRSRVSVGPVVAPGPSGGAYVIACCLPDVSHRAWLARATCAPSPVTAQSVTTRRQKQEEPIDLAAPVHASAAEGI